MERSHGTARISVSHISMQQLARAECCYSRELIRVYPKYFVETTTNKQTNNTNIRKPTVPLTGRELLPSFQINYVKEIQLKMVAGKVQRQCHDSALTHYNRVILQRWLKHIHYRRSTLVNTAFAHWMCLKPKFCLWLQKSNMSCSRWESLCTQKGSEQYLKQLAHLLCT